MCCPGHALTQQVQQLAAIEDGPVVFVNLHVVRGSVTRNAVGPAGWRGGTTHFLGLRAHQQGQSARHQTQLNAVK